ncbi:hypothetical protein RRG08_061932 [Elysia crispata]|uniref:Uncharacterized protein n=1 Tax=Elysia crispata TaxID=231223 RepID=A0AAE1E5Q0_9GAST|nr:hypothetical protein RRG08_061932 [Elysia crispata]
MGHVTRSLSQGQLPIRSPYHEHEILSIERSLWPVSWGQSPQNMAASSFQLIPSAMERTDNIFMFIMLV